MDNLLQSYIQTPEVEKDTFNQSFISGELVVCLNAVFLTKIFAPLSC